MKKFDSLSVDEISFIASRSMHEFEPLQHESGHCIVCAMKKGGALHYQKGEGSRRNQQGDFGERLSFLLEQV